MQEHHMQEQAKQIAELLKTLANENRLMIFCALMDGPKNVGEIAKGVCNISQPALSQHLALLKAHGILSSHKSGMNTVYSIADDRVRELIHVLQKYYCGCGEPIERA